MTKAKKILLIVGIVGVAIGGFAITMYLTRNVRRVRGGVIRLQTYDTPPSEEPLEE